MVKNWFLPKSIDARALWLKNFGNKLGTYAAKYGIATADVTDMKNAAAYYDYWLAYKKMYAEYNKKLTAWLAELASGTVAGAAPTVPAPGAVPTVVPAGIFKRAAYWGNRIKTHKDYAESDGKDLGLEGAVIGMKSAGEVKPVFTVKAGSGGHPEIDWEKMNMDGAEIWKRRKGETDFSLRDVDDVPGYTDYEALPDEPEIWDYKLIFRVDGRQYGQWSDVVSITVVAAS